MDNYSLQKHLPKPSPIPRMTRRKINRVSDSAKNGVINVDSDHMKTARDKITLPLYRLAAVAPITYKSNIRHTYIQRTQALFLLKLNHNVFREIQTVSANYLTSIGIAANGLVPNLRQNLISNIQLVSSPCAKQCDIDNCINIKVT